MRKYLHNILGETLAVDKEVTKDIQKTIVDYTRMASETTFEEMGSLDGDTPEQNRIVAALSALSMMQGVAGKDGIDGVLGFTVGAIMAAVQVMIRSKMARVNAIAHPIVNVADNPYRHEGHAETMEAMVSMVMKATHQIIMSFEEMKDGLAQEALSPEARAAAMEAIHSGDVIISPESRATMEKEGVSEEEILKLIKEKLLAS